MHLIKGSNTQIDTKIKKQNNSDLKSVVSNAFACTQYQAVQTDDSPMF